MALVYRANAGRGGIMMTDLKFDQHNANQGTARGRELLLQSLQELGAGRSGLVDKDGNVIAGNKTLEVATKLGLKIKVIKSNRDELVMVQRDDLDLNDPTGEARRLAYLDNRVAELDLSWDAEQVAQDIENGMALLDVGFTDKELMKILMELEPKEELHDPGPQLERADELQKKWQVQEGQVWQLGSHRIMCGDSTVPGHVGHLMGTERATLCWTDPPWNVNYGGSDHPCWRKRTMNNDNLGDKFPEFVTAFVKNIWDFCIPGAVIYLVMSAQEWPVVDKTLRDKGFHWSSTIIWVKDQLVLSRKDFHTQYEPLWYGWKSDAARVREVINRKVSDVWKIDRPKISEDHPTEKPLELIERSLEYSSLPGDLIFDPFSGSGSTLVASERMGRRCAAIDNDPKYVAVGLERWSVMTGKVPVLRA
jgi:DNA modification methylase